MGGYNVFAHIGCWFTSFMAGWGLLLQDVIIMGVSLVGGLCSLLVVIMGRIEARRLLREEQRRTAMIESLITRLASCSTTEQGSALRRLIEITEAGKR